MRGTVESVNASCDANMLTPNHFSNLNNKHYRKKSIATPVWGLAFFLTAAGSGGSAGPVRSARWRPWYQPITWTHTRTKHTETHHHGATGSCAPLILTTCLTTIRPPLLYGLTHSLHDTHSMFLRDTQSQCRREQCCYDSYTENTTGGQ